MANNQGYDVKLFSGKLRPTSPWPQKLVAKFRTDVGDSL